MPKTKHRWKKIRSAVTNPRKFYYVGLPDGRTEVFRGYNAFDWGPLDVDRAALRRLLGILNGLKGDSIERVGRELCNKFKKEYDEGKHRPPAPILPKCFLCFDDGVIECICHAGAGTCNLTCNGGPGEVL